MYLCGENRTDLNNIKRTTIGAQKFKIENITVAKAPLLKVYYWESFGIDGFNQKLETEDLFLHHVMHMPTTQINSKPLKTVFWLRNLSAETLQLRLKRVKNCNCIPMQTRVGFNQFRQLYHCPHRRLIHILNEHIIIRPDELVALSIVAYFFLFGEHKLTYQIHGSDSRVITFDINVDIIGFDPQKCHITKELIPTDIHRFERFVQPIWVRNITMQHIQFMYSTKSRGLKLLNPNLTVPRLSVWPLMIQYRPSDTSNELELISNFDCIRTKFTLKAQGFYDSVPPDPVVPTYDYECNDYSYVIYPNRLDFQLDVAEERSLMICIHNYNQKCVELRWQNYIINDLFEITFVPNIFRLKPHHSKLCVAQLNAHTYAHFKRIPAVLEVHRIESKSTRIAKELLEEIESIDDPKWAEDSYMEHVFLHIDVKVNEKIQPSLDLQWMPVPKAPRQEVEAAMAANKRGVTTVFEKLFWDYLSKSAFMRSNKDPRISDELTYEEVLQLHFTPSPTKRQSDITKNEILRTLSQLLAEGVRELAKNWRFVPVEECV